jgi:hypothetical protein
MATQKYLQKKDRAFLHIPGFTIKCLVFPKCDTGCLYFPVISLRVGGWMDGNFALNAGMIIDLFMVLLLSIHRVKHWPLCGYFPIRKSTTTAQSNQKFHLHWKNAINKTTHTLLT